VAALYDAFWIPGLDSDFDADEALRLGFEWLDRARYAGGPLIVLYAKKMIQNRPSLAQAAHRFPVVSPQSHGGAPYAGKHAVLAVWTHGKTLDFAEECAHGGGLCVIPAKVEHIRPWISRTGAINLTDPEAPPEPMSQLAAQVKKLLDGTIAFDGHNGFLSGGGKEDAIDALRRIAAQDERPASVDLENYVRSTGEVDAEGAARLRQWYEGVLQGRGFRDYRGRPI
jgi:hypothetical protein